MALYIEKKIRIVPVDVTVLLDNLELGIGQAASLCGITIRQLSYWTEKGIIPCSGTEKSRCYNLEAIEKIALIKQVLDSGCSLESATCEVEIYLAEREEDKERVSELNPMQLKQHVKKQVDELSNIGKKMIRNLHATQVIGEDHVDAKNVKNLEKIISFFEENPFTITTAHDIALRLGRNPYEVENDLKMLEGKRFLQRISYKHADVYRYIPPRSAI